MSSITLTRGALLPRAPEKLGASLALALLAHALLIVALAFGVRWRASEPAGVEAELWAAVPQIAAPRAVAPEPTPVEAKRPEPPAKVEPPVVKMPDPQIAIEKEKARREEAKRDEARQEEARREQARQKEEQQRKKEQAEKERREAAEREAARVKNIERMMGQAGGTGEPRSTGSAAQSAGPSAGYAGRIKARIKPNIVFADSVDGNPLATVEVRLAPDGTITSKRLIKSSGVRAWDEAVLRAVEKTEVLPRDVDGRVPSPIEIDFRPRD